jgi:hypothetical protein
VIGAVLSFWKPFWPAVQR